MKILFVTHHFLTGKSGGAFASKAYINAFAKNSTEMKLLYPIKDKAEKIEDIDQNIKLCPISYSKPKWKKFLDLLIGRVHRYYHAVPQLFTECYYYHHYCHTPGWRIWIAKIVRTLLRILQ